MVSFNFKSKQVFTEFCWGRTSMNDTERFGGPINVPTPEQLDERSCDNFEGIKGVVQLQSGGVLGCAIAVDEK